MSVLTHSEKIGRLVRAGNIQDHMVPTYTKIREAIEGERLDDAVELIDFFALEAATMHNLYEQWHLMIERFLVDKGMAEADLEGLRLDLKLLANHWVEEGTPYDRDAELAKHKMMQARMVRHLNAPNEVAFKTMDEWKLLWRSIHDRDVDYMSGLLNAIHVRHGEDALEEMYRDYVLVDHFKYRYARFDVSKNDWDGIFDPLIYLTAEGGRGHIPDPMPGGKAVEFVEYEDRVEMFWHCGSGGRVTDGDHINDTASRAEAPYYFRFLEKEHDWAWNKKGICHYCAHCCFAYEKLPIERFGYPVRVVEPPTYPDNTTVCKFIMYRNPRDVPEWAYERVGEKKPGPEEPLGSDARGGLPDLVQHETL